MGTGRSGLSKGIKDTTKAALKLLGEQGTIVKRYTGEVRGMTEENFKDTYLRDANPNRDNWAEYSKWRQNCQRACYATDLRLAGYDVEALAHNRNDSSLGINLANPSYKDSFLNVYEGASQNFVPLGGSSSEIMTQLAKLLPKSGARAIVHNYWKVGGGHAWNLVRIGNKIYGIDGQTNEFFNPDRYIKDTTNLSLFSGSTHSVTGEHCINVLVTNKGGNSKDLYSPTELLYKFIKKRKK